MQHGTPAPGMTLAQPTPVDRAKWSSLPSLRTQPGLPVAPGDAMKFDKMVLAFALDDPQDSKDVF